ncbi:MAG: hypothetical protein CMK59_15255 [Proteobacteria bacterium]|nr:hypothetical protein [Pseudomonadota bacterium]
MFSLISLSFFSCKNDSPTSVRSDQATDLIDTDETNTEDPTEQEDCVNDEDHFKEEVWTKSLNPVCYGCHNTQGVANQSDLVLISNTQSNYLETNRERLAYVAGLEREGQSILLRKPLGLDGHGGGAVLTEEDEAYTVLIDFVDRLENPITECEGEDEETTESKLSLADTSQTLRKASLNLIGRLPNATQIARVQRGGEEELRTVLRELIDGENPSTQENTEELFIERMKELWNDQLLTDAYLSGASAIQTMDYDRYPNLYWYENIGNYSTRSAERDAINDALAQAPLELMAHVVRSDQPWTTILTADYMMVNQASAYALGISSSPPNLNSASDLEFYPAQAANYPHTGVLSSPVFLNRYPTTDTNRNRHRSRIIFDYFLNTNILALADRPIDASTSTIHNPTMNDPQCNVCHSVLDPVAGAFQNWDDDGHYNPPETGWYPEMYPPGFEEEQIDLTESDLALRWLAERIVEDPRFAQATVNTLYAGITGFEVLREYELGGDEVATQAWQRQNEWLLQLSEQLIENNYNIKDIVIEIVLSSDFRAIGENDATDAELMHAGTAKLLTPEALNRKIEATLGVPWRVNANSQRYLLGDYQLLYGGIDSDGVTTRLNSPNGIMAAVTFRMANDLACKAAANDFVLPAAQRRLFPFVETTYLPTTQDGFEVPQVQELIKKNIQHLHHLIWGEQVDLDDPELLITYDLYIDLLENGQLLIEEGETPEWLQWTCQGRLDHWTNESIPYSSRITSDPNYTIRAWRGVLSYMLSDYRFIYE